jgi:hypothetical protein
MKKRKQLIDGYWFRLPLKIDHVCCKCYSKHRVEFKIKKGVLYTKWNIINHGGKIRCKKGCTKMNQKKQVG